MLAAAALALTLSVAAPAAAADVFILTATPTDSNQFGTTAEDISGVVPNRAPFGPQSIFGMSPLQVHGKVLPGEAPLDVLAFCIDFATDMHDDGWDADLQQQKVNYAYNFGDVASMIADQQALTKITTLINYGTYLYNYKYSDPVTQTRLAAVQGAIWQVQTGYTFQYHPMYGAGGDNNLIASYVNLQGFDDVPASIRNREVKALFSHDGNSQALAYALRTAVPEPGAWSLMICGFFGAGAYLRKSRRRLAAG